MPRWGASTEYPQHMFLLRNKKDTSIFRMKKVPHLLLCGQQRPLSVLMSKLIWAFAVNMLEDNFLLGAVNTRETVGKSNTKHNWSTWHFFFYYYCSVEIRLNISCELSAGWFRWKVEPYFLWKMIIKMLFAAISTLWCNVDLHWL